jgi:hypothetical protein
MASCSRHSDGGGGAIVLSSWLIDASPAEAATSTASDQERSQYIPFVVRAPEMLVELLEGHPLVAGEDEGDSTLGIVSLPRGKLESIANVQSGVARPRREVLKKIRKKMLSKDCGV